MAQSLLLVDDEENIVSSLKRLLRRDGYEIVTASCAEEALRLLDHHDVGVVISDQRMPSMSGVEFLSLVKQRCPDTVRMMLSGYTELTSVTASINKGEIYKFLTKPWDDDDLRQNVREAFRQHQVIREGSRRAMQLEHDNSELSEAKQRLERDIKEKEREAVLHRRALRAAQTILEHLPVAVVGVDDDGIIACANHAAHQQLAAAGWPLLGTAAGEVLPTALLAVLSEGGPDRREVRLPDGGEVLAWCSAVGPGGAISGRILAFARM